LRSLLHRPGKLLFPFLLVAFPSLPFALPVPPAPVPPELSGRGAQAPESGARLDESVARRLVALERDGGRDRSADTDTLDVLALLVDFSDKSLPDSIADLSDGRKIPRGDWFRQQLERVNDYYRSVSDGSLYIRYTLPDTLFTLPRAMGEYGDDALDWTLGVHWLASDAVELADSTVDFSDFSLTIFIHAGAGQESDLNRDSPEQIWSGYVDFEALSEAFADSLPDYAGIETNDENGAYRLKRFAIAPEKEIEESLDPPYVLGGLGVLVHQMGGYLGMLSLNDYVEPRAQGAGNFDVMSSGLWNALGFVPGPPSAFNRMLMGWSEVVEHGREEAASGLDLSIPSMTQLHRFPISDREYFLVENRDQDGDGDGLFSFDDSNGNHIPDYGESLLGAEWDYFTTQTSAEDHVPGSGLLIWRIDEELLRLTFQLGTNVINAWNDHYGVCLLEADGFQDLSHYPGYQPESYGGDYDAFRAAGGPDDLVATQTALDAATLPDTRSAEGAETGWSFSGIGPHGPVMEFHARWEGDPSWRVDRLGLPAYSPVGDPLGFSGAEGPRFFFAAWDGGDTTRLMSLEPDLSGLESWAEIPDRAAGSPAAGDLDGDGEREIVLLGEQGGVYAWHLDGQALGPSPLLAQLDGWFRTRPLLCDADGDGDMDIFVVEARADSQSSHPLFLDESGQATGPDWPEASGLPVSDPVLLLSVQDSERGYDHPEPEMSTVALALADSSLHILGLPLDAGEPGWALDRDCPCLGSRLASGDLDGDGIDELLILHTGIAEIVHPKGRFAGPLQGRFDLAVDPVYGSGDQAGLGGALLPIDEDGNGSLEMLALYPAAAGLWSADGVFIADWPRALASNAPLVWTNDPAIWGLSLRDEWGKDHPMTLTRDGRLFPEILPGGEPVLLGGALPGSPVLVEGPSAPILMGLSYFERVEGNSAAEDSLETSPQLSFWSLNLAAFASETPAWAMAGGDPSRSGRLRSGGPVDLSALGSREFAEAYPYPNPAGSRVTWRVRTDSPDRVELEIFDMEGQRLWSDLLSPDGFSPAERELALDDFAPGLYFYRIHSKTSGRLALGRLAVIR